MDSEHDQRLTLAAFLVSSVLAGGNAVAIKFSNDELDPLWGAGLRFALAAVLLLLVMVALGRRMPRGHALAGSVLYGLLNFAAGFALAFLALVELEAGFGQIILSLVPLLALFLAAAHGQEAIRVASLGGAVLAIGGTVLLSAGALGDASVGAVLLAVGSAACFAEATVVVRHYQPIDPIAMNAVGMSVGAIVLVGASFLAGDAIAPPEATATRLAVAYMVVLGSIVVFTLYVFILRLWPSSRASYVFVVVPLVTVLLSAWLRDEPLTLGLLSGGALILAGVYVGALRPVGAHRDGR